MCVLEGAIRMDSAVNSCVHKLFKAQTLLFFISEMTLALEWVGWGGGRKQALQ